MTPPAHERSLVVTRLDGARLVQGLDYLAPAVARRLVADLATVIPGDAEWEVVHQEADR